MDLIIFAIGISKTNSFYNYLKSNSLSLLKIIKCLNIIKKDIPIIYFSSIRINILSYFSISKKIAEFFLRSYGRKKNTSIVIIRLSHVIGPNIKNIETSLTAKICYSLINNKKYFLYDLDQKLRLIDVNSLSNIIKDIVHNIKKFNGLISIIPDYVKTVEKLEKDVISIFKNEKPTIKDKNFINIIKKMLSSYE